MAETLFTQLPVAIALTGAEVVPLDQPNAAPPGTFTTKRTTTADIASLAPGAAVVVEIITDSSYSVSISEKGRLLSFSNAGTVPVTLPATGLGSAFANPSWFLQIENRGAGNVDISPSGSETIDGAASLTLVKDQGVLLAVGPDNNWYTQRGTGLTPATAVTSVGLALPASIMSVSGSPVTTTGTLTGTLVTQGANLVWAGPTNGAAATPTFRSIVTADLPNFGTAATYGDASNIPVVTTDAKGRVTATTVAITPGSIGSVAASSLVGNATGAPAAATSISISARFTFTGSTFDVADNGITYAKFQQVTGLSVVGNATNATANAAAITAASDATVLQRSGTSLTFALVSNASLATMTQATLKGRASGAGTGSPTDLSTTDLAPIVGAAFGIWFNSLPTDPSAVPSGGFWNNGGTLAQVP